MVPEKGDRVFVWHRDESKKKSEGIWVRGIVVSQEGAMVLVEVRRAVLRVNQLDAHLRKRHVTRFWNVLVPDTAMSLRSVTIPSLQV